jgi:hypothetical protein
MNRYALRDDQWERIKDLLPTSVETKILSHRRRPVPIADIDPGLLRREDERGDAALNQFE